MARCVRRRVAEACAVKYPKRRDRNERAIVDALRAYGASVTQIDAAGVPDLLVGFAGRTYLLEVKIDESRGKLGGSTRPGEGGNGTLTAAQIKWWAAWKGDPPTVVRTVAEALAAIGCTSPTSTTPTS